jgi:integral membrane sensor domain MASE1
VWTGLGWFITNTSEALIGAFCITRFTDAKTMLYRVQGVFTFVVIGVLFAPLATSFLDAGAVVITGWGNGLWHIGTERFCANALAELTLVPPILICGSNGISWVRKASIARCCEAALLTVATVLVTVLVFGFHYVSPITTPALLYVPLPLLLWAAVRFGPGGLSLSVLGIALISAWYAMHWRVPFPYASMPQNVLSLQILFCLVMVPLLFLSAVMSERKQTEEGLRASEERLRLAQWAARIGTFDWDLRRGVNIWTPETEAMYGLPPGGFGKTREAFQSLVHPDDRVRVVKLIEHSLATGQPTDGEWRVSGLTGVFIG